MVKRSKGILMEVLGPCHDMKAGRHAMDLCQSKDLSCRHKDTCRGNKIEEKKLQVI